MRRPTCVSCSRRSRIATVRSFREAVFSGDELSAAIIILVNGRNVLYLQGLDTPLEAGDEVSIFPMVAGG